VGADDVSPFQQVDEASGPGIAYLKVALQHGDGGGVGSHYHGSRFGEELVVIVDGAWFSLVLGGQAKVGLGFGLHGQEVTHSGNLVIAHISAVDAFRDGLAGW